MPAGFTVRVDGLERLFKVFDKLPKDAQRELKAEIKATAWEMRDAAKRDAPVDEHRLANSISTRDAGPVKFDVVAQTFYAGYMEFGTKSRTSIPPGLEGIAAQFKGSPPGQQGSGFQAILEWTKRKQIAATYTPSGRVSKSRNAQAMVRSVAWLIWRSIKKYGVHPHPFFFKQVPDGEKALKERAANLIKRII